MKQLLSIVSILFLVSSCGNPELEEKVKQLEKENAALKTTGAEEAAAAEEFLNTINEIEANIDQLDLQQEALNIEMQNGIESTETGKERIVGKIQLINTMLEQNNASLLKLANDLSKSNLTITGLQKNIDNLKKRLIEKDSEIAGLKSELVQLNYKIDDLNVTVDSLTFIAELQKEVLKIQRNEIETAYFCFGTKKN